MNMEQVDGKALEYELRIIWTVRGVIPCRFLYCEYVQSLLSWY